MFLASAPNPERVEYEGGLPKRPESGEGSQMHLPTRPVVRAIAGLVALKVVDSLFSSVTDALLEKIRGQLPVGWWTTLSGLSFWWGAGLVMAIWIVTDMFSVRPEASPAKKPGWFAKIYGGGKEPRADAAIIEVAAYIYERTGWKLRGNDDVRLQLCTEIADKLAARSLWGWIRTMPQQPLNRAPREFWRDATIDILAGTAAKHDGYRAHAWFDVHLSWGEVKKVWPSRYPALALPLLQRLGIARKMPL